MKRLKYISRAAETLSLSDVKEIAENASRKNTSKGLTGFLVYYNGIFFQVLEGEEETVDKLYFDKILKDPRHYDILCLGVEFIDSESRFKDWSMKLIDVSEQEDVISTVMQEVLLTLFKSQSILSQYTQPTVLDIFNSGLDPTKIAPRRVKRIIMFADIVNFTTLTERYPPEEVIQMVNHFVEICTKRVLQNKGEITKIMGDKIMACFDAGMGDQAIDASIGILKDMEQLRLSESEGSVNHHLYTGIGMSEGWVIEGNIGSRTKKDYTLMGDAVNLAARLEGITRDLNRQIVFSESIAQQLVRFSVEPLGSHPIKGKIETMSLYSIKSLPPFSYKTCSDALSRLLDTEPEP
jgi:adenylate cyclase